MSMLPFEFEMVAAVSLEKTSRCASRRMSSKYVEESSRPSSPESPLRRYVTQGENQLQASEVWWLEHVNKVRSHVDLTIEQKSFIAGAFAGIISRTATAPMDRVKVAFQAGNAHGHMCQESITSISKKIYASGGWTAFFRGNGANSIKVTPESAVKFWAFSFISSHFPHHDQNRPLNGLEKMVAGSAAGATAQLAIYPLEMAKTYLCLAKPGDYNGIAHCLHSIVQRDGIAGLYRGLAPSLLGILPYAGVDLALFFTLKEAYVNKYEHAPSVGHVLLFGAISSTCGQVVSYPLQVVRTKLQAQGMKGRHVVYTGMRDCLVKIVQSHGISGLYRGILPNFMKSVPAISISYAVFETVKNSL
ncbi:carrier superfamily protein [Thraustotheca clavata]|uniref:Carrier superfamily protein n=1 Tax=Thraustotheca clavata TaxID=74557 RepID=A0A1W0AAR9_9STRA|nr:carrier superfamily protein [Thraustotheca clavata]